MSEPIRLSFYYAALFAVVGVISPFWPLWLKGRGMTAAEIGLILTITAWARMMVNPFIAQAADRYRVEKQFLVILSLLAFAAYLSFQAASGFVPLLLLSVAAGISFNAIMPIGEKQVLARVYDQGLDYGRLRLWGSLSFIFTAWIAGKTVDGASGVEGILAIIYVCLTATVIACVLLPRSGHSSRRPSGSTLFALLGNRTFLLFVASGALIQASHGAYYGFSAIHWQANGIGGGTIAMLWAVGVIAEIVLFALSGWILRRIGVVRLLWAAGFAGVLRWCFMGMTIDPILLSLLQPLHALTFGAAHLGAMHFIAQAVPERAGASAQSLYAALGSGVAMGSSIWLSGQLYDHLVGGTFVLMVGFSLAGLLAALVLSRQWSGDKLISD